VSHFLISVVIFCAPGGSCRHCRIAPPRFVAECPTFIPSARCELYGTKQSQLTDIQTDLVLVRHVILSPGVYEHP